MVELNRPNVDIAIMCNNFEESLRFYRDLLGLEVAMDINVPDDVARKAGLAPNGFRQVRLRAGQTMIKIMDHKPPPPPRTHEFASGVRWLTFFVSDMQKTYEDLKSKGVTFLAEPISAVDAAGVACALDPDGILVELVQLKA